MGTVDTSPAHDHDEYRLALCEWVQAHGLDPNGVPIDAKATVRRLRRMLTIEVFARDADGALIVEGDRVKRGEVTVPLLSDPPEWRP